MKVHDLALILYVLIIEICTKKTFHPPQTSPKPRQKPCARPLILVNMFPFYTNIGFKNSGLTPDSKFLVGIGMSGVMIGRSWFNIVSQFLLVTGYDEKHINYLLRTISIRSPLPRPLPFSQKTKCKKYCKN